MNLHFLEKTQCTGCGACVAVCPSGCIHMDMDAEGFLYPQIDALYCTHCGACEKICPAHSEQDYASVLDIYAVKNLSDSIRSDSSSGGFFSAVAEHVFSNGGCVCGAVLTDEFYAEHRIAKTTADLAPLRGSKYIQSDLSTLYTQISAELSSGKTILFSGTPCQCAAVRAVFAGKLAKIITLDFVCHGVASPTVFQSYLCDIEEQIGEEVLSVRFRTKTKGWKKMPLTITAAKMGEIIYKNDAFMVGYRNGLFLRPCCHQCTFKCLNSGSDLTMADYWGVEAVHPGFEDGLGVSAVLLKTPQGTSIFNQVRWKLFTQESNFLDFLFFSPSVFHSAPCNPRRTDFFKRFIVRASFKESSSGLLDMPPAVALKSKLPESILLLIKISTLSLYRIKNRFITFLQRKNL